MASFVRTGRSGTMTARLALLSFTLLLLTHHSSLITLCRAQTLGSDGIYYSRERVFKIPFQTDGDRRILQVQLYVSEDQGRNWQQAATAQPEDKGFTFNASRNGVYWFTVRTLDQDRRPNPPTIDAQTPPMLRVCVDTQPPGVALRAAPSRDGTLVGVDWQITDDNPLDLDSLRLDYRPAGSMQWLPLNAERSARGQYAWQGPAAGAVDVRLQIKDRAGNLGEALTVLQGGQRPDVQPEVGPGGLGVRKVNTRRISLNYKIVEQGKSGVSTVQLWYTRDKGQTWEKYQAAAQPEPPFVIEVHDEGLYGFTLLARSGVGLGPPEPRAGDPPQVWVEVDLTPPRVEITAVDVGVGTQLGKLTINWKATDKNNNLGRQPINLLYAENAEGPWVPIASRLEHTGRYVWSMPDNVPYKFHVRVEAADLAGNVGTADTPRPVAVDLSQPKVQVLGVEPVAK